MKISVRSVHYISVHCKQVIQSPKAHRDIQDVGISHRQAQGRNVMRGSWRNYLRATGLSHSGTDSTYQGEMVHGGTLFECEIPSVSGKGQKVNYRQQREGREAGMWERQRNKKGGFKIQKCELRPEPQQERVGFKDLKTEQWGRGKGKSLAAWKEEQIKNVLVF